MVDSVCEAHRHSSSTIVPRTGRLIECGSLSQPAPSWRFCSLFRSEPPRCPSEGSPIGSRHLPSCRTGEPRVRIRSAAHPVARSLWPLALGALRSEDVGEPIAPPVFAVAAAATDPLGPPMPLQCPPVDWRDRLMGVG